MPVTSRSWLLTRQKYGNRQLELFVWNFCLRLSRRARLCRLVSRYRSVSGLESYEAKNNGTHGDFVLSSTFCTSSDEQNLPGSTRPVPRLLPLATYAYSALL